MHIFPYEEVQLLEYKLLSSGIEHAYFPRDVAKIRFTKYGWFNRFINSKEKIMWAYLQSGFEDVETEEKLSYKHTKLLRNLILHFEKEKNFALLKGKDMNLEEIKKAFYKKEENKKKPCLPPNRIIKENEKPKPY